MANKINSTLSNSHILLSFHCRVTGKKKKHNLRYRQSVSALADEGVKKELVGSRSIIHAEKRVARVIENQSAAHP